MMTEGCLRRHASTRTQQMAGICPRFVLQEPTDWTNRIRGDGMSPKSGVYLDPTQRFGTTTNRYYTPIIYEPNKPCRRENVSDSTRDFRKRQALKAARKARGRYHRDRYAENRLFEEQTRIDSSVLTPSPRPPTPSPRRRPSLAGFMNEEQKVKEKAKAMLDYFQTTYERDLFATRCQPPENMQRKSNKVLYDRMWGGSRQNMLHSVNKKNMATRRRRHARTQPA